jgi:hypothetical protein
VASLASKIPADRLREIVPCRHSCISLLVDLKLYFDFSLFGLGLQFGDSPPQWFVNGDLVNTDLERHREGVACGRVRVMGSIPKRPTTAMQKWSGTNHPKLRFLVERPRER